MTQGNGTSLARYARHLLVPVLLVVALAATACGGDSTSEDSGAKQRKGSKSDAGIPLKPLAEEKTVKVAMDARVEPFATVLLGDVYGEFARENIKIEYQIMPTQDAIPVLGDGGVDVVATGLQAAAFNAISSGVDIKAVSPAFYKGGPKDGLWVSKRYADCAPKCLKGKKIGSSTGPGSSSITAIQDYLKTGGLNIGDVEIVEFPTADVPAALENDVVAGAMLWAPAYKSIEDGTATQVASQEAGRPSGMYWFGPKLLKDDREAGQAFVRALARTNRLYLDGNYKKDPKVLSALAEAEDVPESAVRATPAYGFSADLKFDPSLAGELQDIWLKYYPKILTKRQPVPQSKVLDMSFITALP